MNPFLIALLETGNFIHADCWTITLNGGSVIRWQSSDRPDIPILANGQSFVAVPLIKRGPISEKRGVKVATLKVEITANATDLINGQPIIPFIKNHGLDGALVKLERAFAGDWNDMFTNGAVGTVIRFAGRITSVDSIEGITVAFTVSSWMVLLNGNMPRNVYQASCLHSLYDSGCTLLPASFSASGTVAGAGATQVFNSSLTPALNDFALGRIVFTSGANAGISRAVKSNTTAGQFALIQPLPNALANGDAFTVYKGCDLLQPTCTNKFNNLNNFKATPFVPLPQTPLSTVSTTTTSKSGGKG